MQSICLDIVELAREGSQEAFSFLAEKTQILANLVMVVLAQLRKRICHAVSTSLLYHLSLLYCSCALRAQSASEEIRLSSFSRLRVLLDEVSS